MENGVGLEDGISINANLERTEDLFSGVMLLYFSYQEMESNSIPLEYGLPLVTYLKQLECGKMMLHDI